MSRKPDDIDCTEDQWSAFVAVCEDLMISLEDPEDWSPWYQFFEAGLNYDGPSPADRAISENRICLHCGGRGSHEENCPERLD